MGGDHKNPQRTVRLNPKQMQAWDQIAHAEDCGLTEAVKRGLKLLAKKHGIEWPRDRD